MKKWVLVGMLLLTICSTTTFVSAAPKVTKMTVHDINQFVETLDEEETPIFTAPETITSSTTSKTKRQGYHRTLSKGRSQHICLYYGTD